ncbi:DUF4976 domain-containing protein [Prolixibacteraceae bacterium JC049]|nr:DUF4976 domain-containing protein [Prolixibacteraceae bacterium JC049]
MIIRSLSFLLLLPLCFFATAKKSKRPNLIVIQTDEHNFRTLGCYREQLSHEQAFIWGDGNNVETPHIDYLAHNGVMFNKFYATSPVCSPSRGTFVSGMYPQQNGVPKNDYPLKDEVITYSKVLEDAGYKTGFIGKWHLDGEGKPQWAPKRKFGFADNRYMFNRGHWKKLADTPEGPQIAGRNKKGRPNYSLDGADDKSFTTDFLTDRAIDFIKENKKLAFSLYLSFPDPHGPDAVREPYNSMYKHMQFKKPRTYPVSAENIPTWATPSKKVKLTHYQYFGMVKCIDDNVGKLIDYLRKEQLLDNTIIVFTSDHGDLRAEHGRHNKGVPLEASAKIPFIVYYPQQIPSGGVIDNAFNTVDFAPSILQFMDQKVPNKMVGRNFSKLLSDPKQQKALDDITFIRAARPGKEGNWIAAVSSRYKLILSRLDEPWLIDMQTDPDEVVNYIHKKENRKVVKQLASQLRKYAKVQNEPFLDGTKMANDLTKLLK